MKESEKMEQQREEAAEAAMETEAATEAGTQQPEQAEADRTAEPEAAETAANEEDSRIQELQRQADDNYQRFLRAQADFDNFRRRTLKEKEELSKYASAKLIGELLPVVDNFQRALKAGGEATDDGALSKGIEMIYRQLSQVLENEGLKAMEPVGQPFDPEVHQAIMQVESEEYGEGIVVEVVQTGYMLKDKVLRPAMVKVSQ
ncbi:MULTISPECIES: nucleotide exchange factor GrpE [Cohnella]|uniref:nucleotide exchange factor GrpE n=1 Tax=Cohnella TaxID=329857 RepID=UPI0009BC5407|nr:MULTISPECIES: nucleotide exchange factor GrpE [Cohnella]MBN2983286.1 nucleotide exchange factor GrpE [Cohnella algarum]